MLSSLVLYDNFFNGMEKGLTVTINMILKDQNDKNKNFMTKMTIDQT